jgi:Zn finger protein HypA/HybF involved in hydrogenase expression
MFAKYVCLGCGITWRSGDIMVICPVCRSKAVKVRNGVDAKEEKTQLSTKKNTQNKYRVR